MIPNSAEQLAGWRSGLLQTEEELEQWTECQHSRKASAKSYLWDGITPCNRTGYGCLPRKQLCRKGPWDPHEQTECISSVSLKQKASCILGSVTMNIASRSRETILPTSSLPAKYSVQLGASPQKSKTLTISPVDPKFKANLPEGKAFKNHHYFLDLQWTTDHVHSNSKRADTGCSLNVTIFSANTTTQDKEQQTINSARREVPA